jgi:2-methylisocitrate lyase-like PEP mutase family enzyme
MAIDLSTAFQSLHGQDSVLLMPNAWDAASALLQQRCGAKAIGTSSAALCWSLGYPDGSALPARELIDALQRISRRLSVPLSVDLEDGYSANPAEAADLVVAIRDAGAVGINIEDGVGASELLVEKIAAIRQRIGFDDLFINARTDVYLRSLAEGDAAVAMVAARARQYADAGASGLFVPGLTSTRNAAQIAAATSLPLNLMALPGLAGVDQLRSAGVRRLSVGPALFLSAYQNLNSLTAGLLCGETEPMFVNTLQYAEMNQLCAS